MFSNKEELLEYIELNKDSERRYFDFKEGLRWDDGEFGHVLIKSILGMSNLKDGGYLIIGVKQQNGEYSATGFESSEAITYNRETVLEAANKYAEPPIDLELKSFQMENQKCIVVIQIMEFSEIPTICKKSYNKTLEEGRIYARTTRKIETSPTLRLSEMREILDLALQKQLTKFKVTLSYTAQQLSSNEDEVSRFYDQESEGF